MAHALIPALGRQRKADLCEFEDSLVYRMSTMTNSKATEKQNQREEKNMLPPLSMVINTLISQLSGGLAREIMSHRLA